jgi:NAD(P)-dependent dehydrogenase (short-subunit alcohol dehydrogenase family)
LEDASLGDLSQSLPGHLAVAPGLRDGPPGLGRLAGRVALVFGAGSSGPGWGNGKAAAVLYAREGAAIAAIDIRREAAVETGDVIRREGGTCEAFEADVTCEADVARVVAAAATAFGTVDILHNNVGVTGMGDVAELELKTWSRVMDTNLTGAFLTCKHVLPLMLAQRQGAIVNISSTASVQVNSYPYPAYFAAKAGLNQLTRAIAVRHAPDGIRANAILPGVMNTPLIHTQIAGQFADVDEMLATRNAASPMGRMGDAWDVAQAAVFLASDEARYITGVCLPVDGGKSCAGR